MNELINHEAVYRTVPATPGLLNTEVNAFFEQKKLKLAEKKCIQIHVGRKCGECEMLYIHGEHMKQAQEV